MLEHYEVGEEPFSGQWFCQNQGMPKIDLELVEGSFTFVGPDKLLAATKNVEEGETLVSRPGDKLV